MARDLSQVDIVLRTPGVTRQSFGIPIFFYRGSFFEGDTRSFGDVSEAARVLPTGSNAYKAVQAFFLNSPSVSIVKVGQFNADTTIYNFTPSSPVEGELYSLNISLTDQPISDANPGNPINFTAPTTPDEEDIVDGLVSAINADVELSTVITAAKEGTGSNAVVTIEKDDAANNYYIKQYSDNLVLGVESGGSDISQSMQALVDVDPAWYGVTSEFRSQADVEELATEAGAREKLYFVSDNSVDALVGETVPTDPTDILSTLFNNNTTRTVGFWHQNGGD